MHWSKYLEFSEQYHKQGGLEEDPGHTWKEKGNKGRGEILKKTKSDFPPKDDRCFGKYNQFFLSVSINFTYKEGRPLHVDASNTFNKQGIPSVGKAPAVPQYICYHHLPFQNSYFVVKQL